MYCNLTCQLNIVTLTQPYPIPVFESSKELGVSGKGESTWVRTVP